MVTVERYGVLDSWVEELANSTPVIEVPIKPDYIPGFYLSIVVLSPRVDKPLGPDQVDLGKPTTVVQRSPFVLQEEPFESLGRRRTLHDRRSSLSKTFIKEMGLAKRKNGRMGRQNRLQQRRSGSWTSDDEYSLHDAALSWVFGVR